MGWKNARERVPAKDDCKRTCSDSEDVNLPGNRANEASRAYEILLKRYTEGVAAHELAAYLGWLTLDGNERGIEVCQSFERIFTRLD